ncbi:MAG: P1 family peptidase [Anaerolineales bacterium]|nr:P1 family peptidase [Anaerolineales bacterium]
MGGLTSVPGFKVGHAQDMDALTGCTVILCPPNTVGGVDQRGGAPGTRETDLLHPMHLVNQVTAILLTGGSAFGLDAAGGVMRYCEENKMGFNAGVATVPIVPAAVLFDLGIGDPKVRPDAEMGYQACLNASADPSPQGNVGAGTGATVGKILSLKMSTKSGIGTASIDLGGGGIVAAMVAVNAFGDVIDPENGEIIAGARGLTGYADTVKMMKSFVGKKVMGFATGPENTVIGAVATNVKLNKEQVTRVAQMAHNGLARTVRPAFTLLDGDTVFALSSGEVEIDLNVVGAYAAIAYQEAILSAVRNAEKAGGVPASKSN